MNYLEGTEQLKKLLKEQSDLVVPNLQDIVKKLIGFVQEGNLFSFEFYGNMSNGDKPDKIIIFLTPTKAHRKINLGMEVSNLEFFEKSINESCEKSPEIRKAIHDLLLCEENHSEYVLTFSRFVIFPKQFSHKDIADHLFYDFIIKGAGNVVFENVNGKPHAKAYGESIELDMKANKVDEEILNDGFHLS